MKCVWCNSLVYDGIERTWKMKVKSSFLLIWITSGRPIFWPFATHTLGTADIGLVMRRAIVSCNNNNIFQVYNGRARTEVFQHNVSAR